MLRTHSLLPGLVKIGRSKNPLQRAIDLQESQPYHIKIHALFWGLGWREKEVHKNLASFRVEDAPGQEWFELPVHNACQLALDSLIKEIFLIKEILFYHN